MKLVGWVILMIIFGMLIGAVIGIYARHHAIYSEEIVEYDPEELGRITTP